MEHPELCVTHPASPSTPMSPLVVWDVDNDVWDSDNCPLTPPSEIVVWSDGKNITTLKLRGKKLVVPATPPRMVMSEEFGSTATPLRATKNKGVPTSCKPIVGIDC